jgi:ketosteroid isomerase-like protein
MDSYRSLGNEPAVDGRAMRLVGAATSARSATVAISIVALMACASQMGSIGGFRSPTDAASIKAVLDTTAAGWNRGELPVYLSGYVDSATAMGSTGLVRGVSGIEGQMRAGFWRSGRPLQNQSYDHLEIRPIGPDQAIVTGQYVLTGGGRPDRTGWFSTIWIRTPRGWRMVHDHSS